jgi:hypothetical protein
VLFSKPKLTGVDLSSPLCTTSQLTPVAKPQNPKTPKPHVMYSKE